MEEEAWKSLGEEWAQPHAHRGFSTDEDFRAGDGFSSGMSTEHMMQYRMSEYGALRRGDPRAGVPHGGAGAEFYNGQGAGNGAGYHAGAAKEEMGRSTAEMLHAMNEGSAHGESILVWGVPITQINMVCLCLLSLTLALLTGMGMHAPNLANTLQNTTLGNYLTVLTPLRPSSGCAERSPS